MKKKLSNKSVESKESLFIQEQVSDFITSLDALSHIWKASHLFGQNSMAPLMVLQRLKASEPVSLAGKGSLLKYMSWDDMLALNCFTAASVSSSPVIFRARARICVKNNAKIDMDPNDPPRRHMGSWRRWIILILLKNRMLYGSEKIECSSASGTSKRF